MITKWAVSNFKSIQHETALDLGGLTVFAGANSSGKSTFIQSILLVAQTLEHKVRSIPVILNGRLVSLGKFEDLEFNKGDNKKKNRNNDTECISIQCTCKHPLTRQTRRGIPNALPLREFGAYLGNMGIAEEINFEISFNSRELNQKKESSRNYPELLSSKLVCSAVGDGERYGIFIDKYNRNVDADIMLSKFFDNAESTHPDLLYSAELDDNSMAEIRAVYPSANYHSCILRHFRPYQIICEVDEIREDAHNVSKSLKQYEVSHRESEYIILKEKITQYKDSPEIVFTIDVIDVFRKILKNVKSFNAFEKRMKQKMQKKKIFTAEDFYNMLSDTKTKNLLDLIMELRRYENLENDLLNAMKASTKPSDRSGSYVLTRVPFHLEDASSYIDDFFSSSIRYLGPLRETPKAVYPLSPTTDPRDVGLNGERTASVLELYKDTVISYIPSSRFSGQKKNIDKRMTSCSLEKAVGDWLKYLGIAEVVKSQDQGELGHGITVGISSPNEARDLKRVGVGVSQVLPILVSCLLADEDSTLIFEQPELHLHPSVQALLGDFFVSIALSNKQCIVESHSEYLVDRLRYRFASTSSTKKLDSLIRVYFVNKDEGVSKFRHVGIDEYGSFVDWPEGFFDESHQQSAVILRAAMKKRKMKK